LNHLPILIIDLAFILTAAAISILVFSRFKQPVVLGYLIAGFAAGPHVKLWPTVVDIEGVKLWAEIGVIFLLFGLGLEFSFKKLAKVGKSASIAAACEVITMTALGYVLGQAFGWSAMDSIYLGAILSMSSTTIIIRAFGEAGLKGKGFVSLVFGILIVEDLLAILIMVFLTELSVSGNFSAGNILYLTAKLGFFLLIWFLVGIYVLPTLLKKFRNLLSNEIMLVVSISLCLLMVVFASKAGFSAALGAFIMGSILAETHEGERIEHLIIGVKDLFAAVFFVSVGMLIDPVVLQENFGVVLIITAVTIVGKLIGSGTGSLLSGQGLRKSFQAGMSLAQIGEFSFIIATLGMTLKVTSPSLYPIVIAVSAVTTFTTPYMIKLSEPCYLWFEKKLPKRLLLSLERYEKEMATTSQISVFGLFWKLYGLLVLLNSVVVIAIALVISKYLMPFLFSSFEDTIPLRVAGSILALILASPFLGALMFKVPTKITAEEMVTLTRLKGLKFFAVVLRVLIALALIIFTINQFSRTENLFLINAIIGSLIIWTIKKILKPIYSSVENKFLNNLNAKEISEMEKELNLPELAPWDATLVDLTLSADSVLAGNTLEESRFRKLTGATVAMIFRGSRKIFAPGSSEKLLPNDQIFLIGTDEQLTSAQELIEVKKNVNSYPDDDLYNLESFYIREKSSFANKSIRDIGIGESLGILIVGIERKMERILNPEPLTIIKPGDLLWVFGESDKISKLTK
jgi:CPA2 family monovalent cation:H+ antiporter-2